VEIPSTTGTLETPLAKLHLNAGAKMGVWFGCALPDDFGDAAAEYRCARESVALIDKNYRAYLSFAGPDRVRYLNAILTNNIKELAAGQGNVSLLLNPQGHILAEIETYAFADRLFCVSYAMIREPLIEWLDKFIIMDDVTLTDETERYGTLALEGPKATAVVKNFAEIDLDQMSELSSVDAEIIPDRAGTFPTRSGQAGRSAPREARGRQDDNSEKTATGEAIHCRIVKRSLGGIAGAEFVVERGRLEELWQILADAARKNGGGPMGYTALSALRLAQSVPWFGYDFGEKQIPHEAGLQDSHISYSKGCYTGQEIVERVRSRGQVNRRRVELIFSGDAVPEAGAVLAADGKEAGYVTRSAKIWDPPRIIGMGYARREASAPGSTLQWTGGTATVAQFPT
jgi:folate-binding protein YgfZ